MNPRRLCQFPATTAETTYYTVPASNYAIIKNVVLANTATTATYVNLSVVPSGGTAGSSNRIIPGCYVQAQAVVSFDLSVVMTASDFISCSAGANSAVTVTVSGVEDSGSGLSTGGTYSGASQTGIQTVTSSTRPASPSIGQAIYESDTNSLLVWNGGSWALNSAPQTLAYAENFANGQAITTTTTAIAGSSVTVNVPAGRRLRISAKSHISTGTTAQRVQLAVMEGGTILNQQWWGMTYLNAGEDMQSEAIISPSAGSHTYYLAVSNSGGTGYAVYTTGTIYNYIRVEDVTGTASPVINSAVPVGSLGYSPGTASSAAASTVDSGLSVNFTVPAGRTVRLTWYEPAPLGSNATDDFEAQLLLDGVAIQKAPYQIPSANDHNRAFVGTVLTSPSAGVHTFTAQMVRTAGTGTIQYVRSSVFVGYLLVEDITPTPSSTNYLPSSTLGYAEVTANQTGITTEVDLTGLSVAVNVTAGRRLRITARGRWQTGTANAGTAVAIYEDATMVQQYAETNSNINLSLDFFTQAVRTPTAGSHTYKLRMANYNGGTTMLGASASVPAFILVEDITSTVPSQISTPGLQAVTSASRPASPAVAASIYETDTSKIVMWNGTAWVEQETLGGWTDYTPTLTATGGGLTLGTGSQQAGRWTRMGRTVLGWASIKFGTSGAAAGTGTYNISLPVASFTPLNTSQVSLMASGYIFDSSAGDGTPVIMYQNSGDGTNVKMITGDITGLVVAATAPWTWAASDEIRISFIYEAAS